MRRRRGFYCYGRSGRQSMQRRGLRWTSGFVDSPLKRKKNALHFTFYYYERYKHVAFALRHY